MKAYRQCIAIALLGAMLPAAGLAQIAYLDAANVTGWSHGRYAYRSLDDDAVEGEEEWFLTVHADGTRTLRATNSYDQYTQTFRQVVMRVAANFRPLEVYTTSWVDGAWRGSGWFVVDGERLDVSVSGPNGRHSQSVAVPEQFSMVPHPISTDSWPAWYYDRETGGPQAVTLYAIDGRGFDADGIIGGLQQTTLEFKGRESVETPAGVFTADRFVMGEGDPELFIFGADRLLAKMTWRAAGLEYVLTEYQSDR